jgi:hypothetical protein
MEALTSEIPTENGDVMVVTKARALFFRHPHTNVMPVGLSRFGMKLGFRAKYNTSDPKILADLHWFFVDAVAHGQFQALLANAKRGIVDLDSETEHLRPYFVGFNA